MKSVNKDSRAVPDFVFGLLVAVFPRSMTSLLFQGLIKSLRMNGEGLSGSMMGMS